MPDIKINAACHECLKIFFSSAWNVVKTDCLCTTMFKGKVPAGNSEKEAQQLNENVRRLASKVSHKVVYLCLQ